MRVERIPALLVTTLTLGFALAARPAAGQACPPTEAGPIWSTQDAQTKCPQTCGRYGSWNGQWWTTVSGEMSVCQCCLDRPAAVPIEAGPIWSTEDAQGKCPRICSRYGSWNGQWRTTVWAKMSVCDCQIGPVVARSVDSRTTVTVTFSNTTQSPIEVLWLDYEGQEKHYGSIEAGREWRQQTFATHPWRFKQDGRVVSAYTATENPQQYYVIEALP